MLSRKAVGTVGMLSYFVTFDKTPADPKTVDRILECFIYDPLSKVTPEQRLSCIEEALQSDADLSRIGPQCPHSDHTLRNYLSAVAEAIRSKRMSLPTIHVTGEISERHREILEPLLVLLKNTPDLGRALLRFEQEVLATWLDQTTHVDAKLAIGYLLKTDYSLAELTDNKFSEAEFRQFLLEAAWKIQDHQRIIEADK